MNGCKKYKVTLTGQTPLLMHKDNITWCERVKRWQKDPNNKKDSVAGDDRSPAWIWLGYAYHNKAAFVLDSDNLMSMLRDAGKKCPAANGRGSLKAATQSGIQVTELGWPVSVGGKVVPWEPFAALADESDFDKHAETAEKYGIELFVKRAKIGAAKHVRVRPKFENWSAAGEILVLDSSLTLPVLRSLFDQGGRLVGLCDWRPGAPASGRYGMFAAEIKEA